MARRLRIEYPGATYHVINRGNYRDDVFGSVGAAKGFEEVLGETCERWAWVVHAYVLMRNHFHLYTSDRGPPMQSGIGGVKCGRGDVDDRIDRAR